MGLFSKKKKEEQVKNPILEVKAIMEDLEDPNWLIEDMEQFLEEKRQTMSDQVLHKWLKDMGNQDGFELPKEYQNEQKLLDIYQSHSGWVKEQIQFYEEVTDETFDKHAENFPQEIKKMSSKAQEAYLAISTCLLNAFSQI